jgi:hypothetical protein
MAVMIDHIRTAPKPPSKNPKQSIPRQLDQIVLACLQKAPEQRPASALELWQQLGEVPVESPWDGVRAERWWRENHPAGGLSYDGENSSDGNTLR